MTHGKTNTLIWFGNRSARLYGVAFAVAQRVESVDFVIGSDQAVLGDAAQRVANPAVTMLRRTEPACDDQGMRYGGGAPQTFHP